MTKKRFAILVLVFIGGIYYQPNWIYQTFYYKPRWVDDAWWSLSYPAYLVIYSLLTVGLIEMTINLIKKLSSSKI